MATPYPLRGKRILFFVLFLTGISNLPFSTGYAAEGKETSMSVAVGDKMTVQFEYTLTVDGAVVDTSNGRAPLQYVHGQNQIIPGLERALAGLRVGDSKEVTVSPDDGYGPVDPNAFIEVSRKELPQNIAPEVGMVLSGTDPTGQPLRAKIAKVDPETVKLDLNHPLAGKTLYFKIKIVEITPPADKN